jgi:hypothetical protein
MSNNFQIIKNNIKPGDILLSRLKKDPISKTIRGITQSHWSHSSIYIGDNKIVESNWNGVRIQPLEEYSKPEYVVGLFRITPELTEQETKGLIKFVRKQIGIHYGYLQLLWQLILRLFGKSEDPDWALDVDKGLICSELIALSYAHIGRALTELEPSQTEPVDLDSSSKTIRIV